MEFSTPDRLIFVVLDHEDGFKSAIENNHGIVVFGKNIEELKTSIPVEVNAYFKGTFKGAICIREFIDTMITA